MNLLVLGIRYIHRFTVDIGVKDLGWFIEQHKTYSKPSLAYRDPPQTYPWSKLFEYTKKIIILLTTLGIFQMIDTSDNSSTYGLFGVLALQSWTIISCIMPRPLHLSLPLSLFSYGKTKLAYLNFFLFIILRNLLINSYHLQQKIVYSRRKLFKMKFDAFNWANQYFRFIQPVSWIIFCVSVSVSFLNHQTMYTFKINKRKAKISV